MCVIAFSPKGIDIPTDKQLEKMWNANHDGAGFAYVKHGKVHYRKGFLTLAALKAALADRTKYKNTPFAIHFRIGTAGKNDQYTTHPFPLSTRYQDLRQTRGADDAVLFHNGILAGGGLADPHSSDTQDFVVAMAPLLRKYTDSSTRDGIINTLTQGNRLLILYGDGNFKMYGEWERDGDIFVSNKHYDYSYYGYNSVTTPTYPSEEDAVSWWNDFYHNAGVGKEDIDKMWLELMTQGFLEVSPLQLRALKHDADDFTLKTITRGGVLYEYDADDDGGVIWIQSMAAADTATQAS